MQQCGRFEVEFRRGFIAFGRDVAEQRLTSGIEELTHARSLCSVLLVTTSLVAGCETHFHLGVDASRKRGIGIQFLYAAAEFEEVERVVSELLGHYAGREWAIVERSGL